MNAVYINTPYYIVNKINISFLLRIQACQTGLS